MSKPQIEPCTKCDQVPVGQSGEYPCSACGLPTRWDDGQDDLYNAMRLQAPLDVRADNVVPTGSPADAGRLEQLAKGAFDAYAAERGGLTVNGGKIPPWEAAGDGVRAAWRAAALSVATDLTADMIAHVGRLTVEKR